VVVGVAVGPPCAPAQRSSKGPAKRRREPWLPAQRVAARLPPHPKVVKARTRLPMLRSLASSPLCCGVPVKAAAVVVASVG
jgi:hypothetical protein